MTGPIERMKEALALPANGIEPHLRRQAALAALIPEAIKEIERLRNELDYNIVKRSEANQRSIAAEAKLAKAVEALKRIASGGLSGYVLTSNPPQDPAVVAAELALRKIGEKP